MEVKEIHYKTLLEEKLQNQEKIRELEKTYNEKQLQMEIFLQQKQEKSLETAQTFQAKELEFSRFKQEKNLECENLRQNLQKNSEKFIEMEKAIKHYQLKTQEIEKENNLLIQEIVAYRRMNINTLPMQIGETRKINQKDEKVVPTKLSKEIYGIEDLKKEIAEENEVHSVLFSEDMGPATPLRMTSPIKRDIKEFKKSNFLTKSAEMELKKRIKELEAENYDYKKIIENMAEEMQNVKSKLQLSQQIKEDNLLRLHNLEKEIDIKNEDLHEKQKLLHENSLKLNELKSSNEKLMQKNKKLAEEREKLIEISQKLQAKLRVFEDEDSDNESWYEDDNKYSRRIHVLEEKLQVLQGEIIKWKEIEAKKNEMIEKLKRKIIDSQKNPLTLAEYEEIRSLNGHNSEDLDDFKQKLNELQAEINKDLKVNVKKKPLLPRSEENLEKNQIYQKNSEKELISQKKNEDKLQTKKKSPKIVQKVRNYNMKI